MKVKLIDYTKEPLKVLTQATLVSYWDEWSIDKLDQITDKDAEMHIPKVLNYGHESILEHIKLTWAIEGISRVTSHQLVRHRLASYTQRSQRYIREGMCHSVDDFIIVENPEKNFVIPESFKKAKFKVSKREWYGVEYYEDNEYMEVTGEDYFKKYLRDLEWLYCSLIEKGVPHEDARYVLPQAVETKIVVTMNFREFKHFAGLRMCERAQWEIRELAWKMWKEVYKVPELRILLKWAKVGPRCIQLGYCPEKELMPERCLKRQKEWWKKVWR